MPNERQRRYTDEEVSVILRLAMDKGSHDSSLHDGMSLDELVDVAAEAGFAPDVIRSAAERLDTLEAPSNGFDLLGARPYTEIVRVVDGEVSPDDWDEVVAEVRSAFKGPTGKASHIGKTSEWYTGSEFTATHMSFTPEGGRTKMKARLTMWGVPLLCYSLVTFLTAVATVGVWNESDMVSAWGASLSLVFVFLAWLVAMGAVRWLIRSWYLRKVSQMKDALDRAQEIVGHSSSSSVQSSTVQEEEHLREQLGSTD